MNLAHKEGKCDQNMRRTFSRIYVQNTPNSMDYLASLSVHWETPWPLLECCHDDDLSPSVTDGWHAQADTSIPSTSWACWLPCSWDQPYSSQ